MRAVVEAALEDCEALREEKDASIEQKLPEDDVEVEGDGDALRRALANLLVNAIKHGGEDNAITVTVEARGDRIAIEVADRGPGIAEDDRAHLFEAFYRSLSTFPRLEFKLLRYFIENRGATLSRDELLNRVWGYDATDLPSPKVT